MLLAYIKMYRCVCLYEYFVGVICRGTLQLQVHLKFEVIFLCLVRILPQPTCLCSFYMPNWESMSTFMFVFILCVYVCVYVYLHVCVYFICLCLFLCLSSCLCLFYVSMSVSMFTFMFVFI